MAIIKDVVDALAVVVLDKRIHAWLAENDPQALKQAVLALRGVGFPFRPDPNFEVNCSCCTEDCDKHL